jgi:uncharacterized protein (TIGR02118 family)
VPDNYLIQIVAAESTPEKDAAFEKWYTEKHVPMLFRFPGVKKASRYRLQGESKGSSRYLTFYEFESAADLEAFPKSRAYLNAIADFEKMKDKVAFTMRWTGVYELIRSWQR